jgi:hypothetical protein
MASEQELALPAILGQRTALGETESCLLLGKRQSHERLPLYVTEKILRVNIVVARVNITVMFEHQCSAALTGENTYRPLHAHPLCQCTFEVIDEYFSDVSLVPFIKHLAQKRAVIIRGNAPFGND